MPVRVGRSNPADGPLNTAAGVAQAQHTVQAKKLAD